jgi:hypothetical protein
MSKRKQPSILASLAKVPRLNLSTSLPTVKSIVIEEEPCIVAIRNGPIEQPPDPQDISLYVQAGQSTFTDDARFTILTKHFTPSMTWKGPFREIGSKQRRVPAFVFDTANFPSLTYSSKEDGVYCADCVAFSPTKVILVSKPITDWSNAKKQVDKHLSTSEHKTAVARSREFLKVCNKQQGPVTEQLSKAYRDAVQQNSSALTAIIKTIILCGHQNLPLRNGKDEDSSNFMALVRFRAETDEALNKHLQDAPKNATYLSPQIQNELIALCGKQIMDTITDECKAAIFYTLLADECADVSNTEQISLCLRYVHQESSQHVIKEQFLTFIPTRDTTGETLTKELTAQLTSTGISSSCIMVGQGYDGAGNMRGHIQGVQGRIKASHPTATYIHCRSHNLNLAICKACDLPEVLINT